MTRKAPPLPDLDDDEFARRLKPLEAMVLPPAAPSAQHPDRQLQRPKGNVPDTTPLAPTPDRPASGGRDNAVQPESITGPARATQTSWGDTRGNTGPSFLGLPDDRNTGIPEGRIYGRYEGPQPRTAAYPGGQREGLIGAAARLTQIEQVRGPKRRFEYLIPARVGEALAEDAARQGKSATVRLLEILRDAGYPVIPEDLIDLRKERRR